MVDPSSNRSDIATCTTVLTVPTIRCAACIGKIERELPKRPGIFSARVNFTAKRVTINHDQAIDLPMIQAALSAIGFPSQIAASAWSGASALACRGASALALSGTKSNSQPAEGGKAELRLSPTWRENSADEVGAQKLGANSSLEDGGGQEAKAAPPPANQYPAGTVFAPQSVREALRDAMAEEMRRDDRVFVIGEEVAEYQGAYKVTQGLLAEFGDKRVIDTPITEHGFAGIASGAAMAGLRPIVEFMTFNFAMQAIDHIINSAAKTNYMSGGQMRCPIVFRGPNGAASRVGAQHSQNYAPWYANVPGLIVLAPYDAADAKGLLKSAIRSEDPVVFLENELLYGQSFDMPQIDDWTVPIGKARIMRPGHHVTLVSYSIGVAVALDAANQLAEQGIEAEVIDLRTLRPLDRATVLQSLAKTNRMVVVEEGWPQCSIAAEIIALAMEFGFDDLDAPVMRVTNVDVPLPYANNLEKMALVKASDVVAAAKKICYK